MKKLLIFLGMCASVFALVGTAGADSITRGGSAIPSIPEPATLVLFGSGLIGLAAVMKKVKKRQLKGVIDFYESLIRFYYCEVLYLSVLSVRTRGSKGLKA